MSETAHSPQREHGDGVTRGRGSVGQRLGQHERARGASPRDDDPVLKFAVAAAGARPYERAKCPGIARLKRTRPINLAPCAFNANKHRTQKRGVSDTGHPSSGDDSILCQESGGGHVSWGEPPTYPVIEGRLPLPSLAPASSLGSAAPRLRGRGPKGPRALSFSQRPAAGACGLPSELL